MRHHLLGIALLVSDVALGQSSPCQTQSTTLVNNPYVGSTSWYGRYLAADNDTLVVCTASHKCDIYDVSQVVPSKVYSLDVSPYGGLASVTVSDDTVVLGIPYTTPSYSSGGIAVVLRRVTGTWIIEAGIQPADPSGDDQFGFSVSLHGDRLVVGARYDDDQGTNSGSAYVFERSGTAWTQVAKLLPLSGTVGSQFGYSVATTNSDTAVGAPYSDSGGPDAGVVVMFAKVGFFWAETGQLLPQSGPNTNFGSSMSIDAQKMVVGAPGWNNASGRAYAYAKTGTSWAQQQELPVPDQVFSALFGTTVAILGERLVVGAPNAPAPISLTSGTIYSYQYFDGQWSLAAKIGSVNGSPSVGSYFGSEVALLTQSRAVSSVLTGINVIPNEGQVHLIENLGGLSIPYGQSCPGSSGTPRLYTSGCPELGAYLTINIDQAFGGSTGVMFASLSSATIPLGFGCTLDVGPPAVAVVFPLLGAGAGNGFINLSTTIPNTVSPGAVFLHALVADPGVAAGFASTNGLILLIES